MKTILISITTLFISTLSFAQDFSVEHINYRITSTVDKTVQVINNPENTIIGDLTIPSKVNHNGTTYSVTKIASAAFFDNQITSVTIPSSIKTIGKCAFRNNQITTINIPDTVIIKNKAFADNNQLELVIPQEKMLIAIEGDDY